MKQYLIAAVLGTALFTACKDKNEELSPSAIQARVDSLVGVRMEELNRQAMDDLDRRMSIEIKAKADSIVAAAMAAAPDTSPIVP